jgi:hypothetical protein
MKDNIIYYNTFAGKRHTSTIAVVKTIMNNKALNFVIDGLEPGNISIIIW